MEITDYGFFRAMPERPRIRLLRFENEKGEDWYDLRRTLTEWEPDTGEFISAIFPAWALVDERGVVTNVEYDPSRLMPGDRRVLGIEAPLEDVHPGMIYRDGQLEEPE